MKFYTLDLLSGTFNSMVGLMEFNIHKKLLSGVSLSRLILGVNGSPEDQERGVINYESEMNKT